MPVFKRYKGRKITPGDPNWDKARWWMEFRLKGNHVLQSIAGARTKAQAQRAEATTRESVYDGRYTKGRPVGFTSFVDDVFLPWARANKLSYPDDERRAKLLKTTFRDQPMREILPLQIERLKTSLVGKDTCRGTPRSGATVNRYLQLLSKIFSMAFHNGVVDRNPCSRVHKEEEGGKRERYLTGNERPRLFAALINDLAFLRTAVEVARGAGLRKAELLQLKPEHINLSSLPVFYAVNGREIDILPNWLLVVRSKTKKPRCVPMNALVRAALIEAMQDAPANELIFTLERNGVTKATIKSGFPKACERAAIVYGLTNSGGLIWHDLRHTFATRLRAAGVHQLDIMQLMGHKTVDVTMGYAHGTPAVIQNAVDRLAEEQGEVLEFRKRASS
jgi:integrase